MILINVIILAFKNTPLIWILKILQEDDNPF